MIEKMVRLADFFQCRRRVRAFIARDDPSLLYFKEAPPATPREAYLTWFLLNSNGKSAIILCLGDAALVKTLEIVHDDDASSRLL